MCLTETYSRVRVGKILSDMFPITNGLKQGDALHTIKKNAEGLTVASKGTGLEVNADKTKCMIMSRDQTA